MAQARTRNQDGAYLRLSLSLSLSVCVCVIFCALADDSNTYSTDPKLLLSTGILVTGAAKGLYGPSSTPTATLPVARRMGAGTIQHHR